MTSHQRAREVVTGLRLGDDAQEQNCGLTATAIMEAEQTAYREGFNAARERSIHVIAAAIQMQRHHENKLRTTLPCGGATTVPHRLEDMAAYEHAAEQMEEVLRQVQELSP